MIILFIDLFFLLFFRFFFFLLIILLLLLQYLSIFKIRSMIVPTLFISGLADTFVPPRMMQELYKNCKSKYKKILPISGGTHNETWCQSGYYENICSFLNELRENPSIQVTSDHWQIDDI